jgi:uncharacterized membrane protein (DUF373 family)
VVAFPQVPFIEIGLECSNREYGDGAALIEEGIQFYKKSIIYIIMVALAITIAALTVSMVWLMVEILGNADFILIDKADILGFLGYFLLVVIGIELLDTLIVYTKHHVVKVEIVILVAITAVARELIVQNYETIQPLLLLGLGGILVAAALTYYLVRKARIESYKAGMKDESEN